MLKLANHETPLGGQGWGIARRRCCGARYRRMHGTAADEHGRTGIANHHIVDLARAPTRTAFQDAPWNNSAGWKRGGGKQYAR